jgi:hypothetical protein
MLLGFAAVADAMLRIFGVAAESSALALRFTHGTSDTF